MSPGATFERVYLALKEKVVTGAFPPGWQLEPASLSSDLVASITPVRDALHRLVGERLVQTPRGDGFRMPIHTEAGLRDLYLWNARLLNLALAARRPALPTAGSPLESQDNARETAKMFMAIARSSESAELAAAIASLNDRLHAVRLKEPALLDWKAELGEVEASLTGGRWRDLRRLLNHYHRRRVVAVPRLIQQMQPSL